MKGKTLPLVVCLAIGPILAACGPPSEPSGEVETIVEYVTSCWVWVDAYVWVDQNANGRQDKGEFPLRDVKVTIGTGGQGVHTIATNKNGIAMFEWEEEPCEEQWISEVWVHTPPGYRPTTRTHISFTREDPYFGFVRDDSTATPTPFPPTEPPAPSADTDAPVTPSPSPSAGDPWIRPADGAVMVYVPAGEFLMGSTGVEIARRAQATGSDRREYAPEQPQHTVYLDAFWIDKHEVTNAQYRKCVEARICSAPTTCDGGERTFDDASKAEYPVVCVSWYDAVTYAAWVGGRLPTEAEWEKAARGTDGQIYPWGYGGPTCRRANISGCEGKPLPVGSHPDGASPYGALAMAGNVSEWVADWYDGDYYSQSPLRNPQGPDSGGTRVVRGGSFSFEQELVRCAGRDFIDPDRTEDYRGFRVVVAPGPSGP
jgi:formylglycine-generating enzyme required for sulfatase activity